MNGPALILQDIEIVEYQALTLEKMMLKVSKYFAYQKYFKGRLMLEAVLQLEPTYGHAHSCLGWYYMVKLFDYKRAEMHYELAMKYYPEFRGNYYNFPEVLFELGKYDEQMRIARIGIGMPGVDEAYMRFEIARAHEAKGEFVKALAECKTALECPVDPYIKGRLDELKQRVKGKTKKDTPWFMFFWIGIIAIKTVAFNGC